MKQQQRRMKTTTDMIRKIKLQPEWEGTVQWWYNWLHELKKKDKEKGGASEAGVE